MNNIQAKKQNRILLICLVVILASATVLVAITGSANKNKKNDKTPPIDQNVPDTSDTADTANTVKPDTPDTSDPATANIDEKPETDKPTEKDEKDDREVSAIQSATDVLPTFSSPIDNVAIKGFSIDVPVFSHTMNDYRTHGGIDFACSPGTPVLAAADGTVCEIVDDPMMGVTVALQHTGGAVTKYKGLSEDSMNLCKVGDTVKRGQVIGASGDTALIESAEEDHLHFELYINGDAQNPAEYMSVTYLSDIVED